MAPSKKKDEPEINILEIAELLRDYFPTLTFPDQIFHKFFIGRRRYFIKEQGKWIINIAVMSKIKDKCIASLFPQKEPPWNEAEARRRYGKPDVIRFFIDNIDDYCFNKFDNAIPFQSFIDEYPIPKRFFADIDYYNQKNILDSWDFSHLVNHEPSNNIYKNFRYYANRLYALLCIALYTLEVNNDLRNRINNLLAYYNDENPLYRVLEYDLKLKDIDKRYKHHPKEHEHINKQNEIITEYLLEIGKEKVFEEIHNKFPKTGEIGDNFQVGPRTEQQKEQNRRYEKLNKLIDKSLESVSGFDAPLWCSSFIYKFYAYIPEIYRNDGKDDVVDAEIEDNRVLYSKEERVAINDYIIDIEKYVIDMEKHEKDKKNLTDLRKLLVPGELNEKLTLLFKLIGYPFIREKFSNSKQNTIRELYNTKLVKKNSLDETINKGNSEEGKTYTRHDSISEEDTGKETVDDTDHTYLTSVFNDELKVKFKKEFEDDTRWESFLTEIFSHFEKHELTNDEDGNLTMNDESKDELFITFCFYAGIQVCDEIKNQFLIQIQRILDKFNQDRKDLRRK